MQGGRADGLGGSVQGVVKKKEVRRQKTEVRIRTARSAHCRGLEF